MICADKIIMILLSYEKIWTNALVIWESTRINYTNPMRIWKQRYHRRSTRLKGYDYSKPWFYFVTICTKNRQHLFGNINNYVMHLNDAGKMVLKCWLEIPNHYSNIKLHELIIMPNHIHGVLEIIEKQNPLTSNNPQVGVQYFEPLHLHLNARMFIWIPENIMFRSHDKIH